MGLKRYVKKARKAVTKTVEKVTKPILKPLRRPVDKLLEYAGYLNPVTAPFFAIRDTAKALTPDVDIDIPPDVENPLPAPSATEANLELVIGARRKRANRGSLKIERTARTSNVPRGTSVNLPR